jgi:hypothetical protein
MIYKLYFQYQWDKLCRFFYKSKLNCFNFTITQIKNDDLKRFCYFWHEGLGNRGVNEIGTGVYKYLESYQIISQAKMYSSRTIVEDSIKTGSCLQCICMQLNILTSSPSLKNITHTQNEGDTIHSIIERTLKRIKLSGPIYVPDQYISHIRNAKKKSEPLHIREMIDIKALYDEMALNITKNTKGDVFKMSEIQLLRFEKNSRVFWYKNHYKEKEWCEVAFKERKIRSSDVVHKPQCIHLKPAYAKKLTISENKLRDFNSLLDSHMIRHFYKSFYDSLK